MRARRRWLAAALAAGAVAFGLEALAPPAPPTTPVVVAAADLSPGEVVDVKDLDVVEWPASLVPAGALSATGAAVGRVLAGAVGRGEAVTALRFVGPTLLGELAGSGRVAAPVRLADADSVRLLRPGDRVDLVAARSGTADPVDGGIAGPATAEVVATAATVVTVPAAATGGAFSVGSSSATGSLVLVAVTRTESLALARAAVLGPVSVVLVD